MTVREEVGCKEDEGKVEGEDDEGEKKVGLWVARDSEDGGFVVDIYVERI